MTTYSYDNRPSMTKGAISSRIRHIAKENEYHVRKSKGLWYIGNMACPPRATPHEGLTDEQAIEWIKENGYFKYPV